MAADGFLSEGMVTDHGLLYIASVSGRAYHMSLACSFVCHSAPSVFLYRGMYSSPPTSLEYLGS